MPIASISPFFRTPMTDLTAGLLSHQLFGRCAQQEMDVANCLESYGLDRGLKECRPIIDEFYECHTLEKQFKRFFAMRNERAKQIREGKLTCEKNNKYITPRVDAF